MAKAPATEEEAATAAAAALQAQLAALRAELTATTSAAGQAAVAERNSLKAQIASASKGAPAAPKLPPLKQTLVDGGALAKMRATGTAAKETARAVAGIGGGSAKPIETIEAGNKGLKLLAKNLGISKAQLRAPLTAGAIELSKLALGVRGMAQLSAIETRAGFQLRSLFKGIDPSPVIRGADRLSQVFNKTSVTGKALEGIFGRAFGYLFGQVEKLAPYAHTAFQGMVLAALTLENGWLRASIALQPLTDAIEEAVGPIDEMQASAYVGAAAIGAVALAAAPAALTVAAVAVAFKAVAAAIEQATKLYKEWDSAAVGKAKLGVGTQESEGAHGIHTGADYDREMAARHAAPAALTRPAEILDPGTKTGEEAAKATATGKAYSEGLAAGVRAGAGDVKDAASEVAALIDQAVRIKTQTHSPSAVAFATGTQQPAGLAGGIRDGTPEVRKAAAEMGAASNEGGASGSGSRGSPPSATPGPISLSIVNNWPAGVAADGVLEAKFDEMARGLLRMIGLARGVPIT